MKRRDFLRTASLASAASFALSGIPLKMFAANRHLHQLMSNSNNDNVLVILQMHGGNDGINFFAPGSANPNRQLYQFRRSNIALATNGARKTIELDSTLPTSEQIGLHPDMLGLKQLYDEGKVSILHGIGTERSNGSHFRARDMRAMGADIDEYYSSGWVGRYIEHLLEQGEFGDYEFPDEYPNTEFPHPFALELGADTTSLTFHMDENIPSSIAIPNPVSFFNLVDNLDGLQDNEGNLPTDDIGIPPEALEGSPYWEQMQWILGIEDGAKAYAEELVAVYNQGLQNRNCSVEYPERYPFNAPENSKNNPLANALRIIATLLRGGIQTRIFMVRIGGFDTHVQQVESYETSMGVHGAKAYHIAASLKAFQDDLKCLGLEDRVLTITTTEFGRSIKSNGSFGTDHGEASIELAIGKKVRPGVVGVYPDMNAKNVEFQNDFRRMYSTILDEWFGLDRSVIFNNIFLADYPEKEANLGFLTSNITALNEFQRKRFRLEPCAPNPCYEKTKFAFYINTAASVELYLSDLQGRRVKTFIKNKWHEAGRHELVGDLKGLKAGVYLYHIAAGQLKDTKKLVVVS